MDYRNDVEAGRREAAAVAARHRLTWRSKPILREVYADFSRRMGSLLSRAEGPSIELGGGPGLLKSFFPGILSSDIVTAPWLDFVADASALPLADRSVGNLVLVDVLHHIAYPRRFFAEAARVLRPGGRVVILDVFLSLCSYPVLRFLHPEPASLSIRPLDQPAYRPLFADSDPWNSDQGMARGIFWKGRKRFGEMFPQLALVHHECLASLIYPLSGGFEHKNRVPSLGQRLLWQVDRALDRVARFTGYRCLVALELRRPALQPISGGFPEIIGQPMRLAEARPS